jgi:hypothetical protein
MYFLRHAQLFERGQQVCQGVRSRRGEVLGKSDKCSGLKYQLPHVDKLDKLDSQQGDTSRSSTPPH